VEYDAERAAANPASFDPSEHKFGNSRFRGNLLSESPFAPGPQFTLCCPDSLSQIVTKTHRCVIEASNRVPGGISSGLSRCVHCAGLRVRVRVCNWSAQRVHFQCRAIEACDFTSSDAALLQNKLRTWDEIFQRQVLRVLLKLYWPQRGVGSTGARRAAQLARPLFSSSDVPPHSFGPLTHPIFTTTIVIHFAGNYSLAVRS